MATFRESNLSSLVEDSREGRAVQIVEFKDNMRPVVNLRAFDRIVKSDIPTLVVSISGVARSGKSFLLNLLVTLLTYLGINGTLEGYESFNNEIKGVNWARSSTAVTLGIWIWSKPFMIRRPTGEKIAVFLLDTQGTGDHSHSDKQLDTLIMLISLQLSSFQLLNIRSYLRSDELSSLEEKKLLELVRVKGFGNCKVQENLLGETEESLQQTLEEIKDLALDVFYREGRHHKYGGSEIWRKYEHMFEEWYKTKEKDTLREHRHAKEMQEMQEIKLKLEQETIVSQAFTKAQHCYSEKLEEVVQENLLGETEESLQLTLEEIKYSTLGVFYREGRHHKYGGSEIWRKYEDMFEEWYKTKEKDMLREHRHAKEMQEVQEMKLKQEQIEREHENRLNEVETRENFTEEEPIINALMLRRGQDVEQHFEESSNGEQSTTRSATSFQIQRSGNQTTLAYHHQSVKQSRPPPSTCIIS
ncbi:RNF112 [Bugula neritina]|uniref:RNF112 n=1 Tax=Bugula neritina TaxID=10212 RepID=A0A7J7JKS0_BUGNE|nr:RNF112 [Bugula neritina]